MTMLFNILPHVFTYNRTQAAIVTVPIVRDALRVELLQLVGNDTFTADSRAVAKVCNDALSAIQSAAQKLLHSVHLVSKQLLFWEQLHKATPDKQLYVMVLERGPWALAVNAALLANSFITPSEEAFNLTHKAEGNIAERVMFLRSLQNKLLSVLGEIYLNVEKFSKFETRPHTMAPNLFLQVLVATSTALYGMEGSYDVAQSGYAVSTSSPPSSATRVLIRLKERSREDTKATLEQKIVRAIELVGGNTDTIQHLVSVLVSHYQQPSRAARYWLRYAAAGAGVAVASSWFIRHSQLSGSDNLDKWSREGTEAVRVFVRDHAWNPLMQIRADLFDTFRNRPGSVAEAHEVRLTADSLRRMLESFASEVAPGSSGPDASDQQLMEIMMSQYERQVAHPVRSLMGGDLMRSMLIQVQKLKLDIETAMLEMDQILRSNEINFAVLAALPAVLVSIGIFALARQYALYQSGRGEEGRGRAAQMQRRMLLADVERQLINNVINPTPDSDEEDETRSPKAIGVGQLVYALHKFYLLIRWKAEALGEWSRLREDLEDIARPNLSFDHKLMLTTRMSRVYECLATIPALT